jgi:hypothetical protein
MLDIPVIPELRQDQNSERYEDQVAVAPQYVTTCSICVESFMQLNFVALKSEMLLSIFIVFECIECVSFMSFMSFSFVYPYIWQFV